eukprot:2676189-Alexandrium_andersonii.AAC.1
MAEPTPVCRSSLHANLPGPREQTASSVRGRQCFGKTAYPRRRSRACVCFAEPEPGTRQKVRLRLGNHSEQIANGRTLPS